MATAQGTWYRISEPGKKDKTVKAGSAPLVKALADSSPGRPKVAKVISPGVYPQARIDPLDLPDSAWTSDKAKGKGKAKRKGDDKAAAQGDDKADNGESDDAGEDE